LSDSAASGSVGCKRAINSISNPDEFDINLLVTPGVIHGLHSTITNHAISKTETRADAFYIMDATAYADSIDTVKSTIKTLDTNYVGVYYPWVKIVDRETNSPVWVPPSVVIPGVISYTDQVAHEWFAPAGLNRGGLTTVLEAKTRLTHSERDDLYENRINPIASFPGQGVVVFGQKTLQSKPSALDRINVRRLLIALRKFIASSSRYLVFEQNTQALRNRFLNIVNPYLEQVQQNSGLSAFRVVMDDSNNTPDVVDRNQLVGQIFIQPTRTAEFIVLDFVVQPTGATFPE
jgi:phage tail sheath protein FI